MEPTCIDYCGSPLENLIFAMIMLPFRILFLVFELMFGIFDEVATSFVI